MDLFETEPIDVIIIIITELIISLLQYRTDPLQPDEQL